MFHISLLLFSKDARLHTVCAEGEEQLLCTGTAKASSLALDILHNALFDDIM